VGSSINPTFSIARRAKGIIMSIDPEAQPKAIKRPETTEPHTHATSLNLRRLKRSFAMATISTADLRKMLVRPTHADATAIYYKRQHRERQEDLWVAHMELATAPGHPFYERLNAVLDAEGFDRFVECWLHCYAATRFGRNPPPGSIHPTIGSDLTVGTSLQQG